MNFIDVWRSLVCFQDSFSGWLWHHVWGMRWIAAAVSQCNHRQILEFGCLIRKIAADDFLLWYPLAIKRGNGKSSIDSWVSIATFDYQRAMLDFGTVAFAEGLVAFSFSASALQRRMDSLAKLDEADCKPGPASPAVHLRFYLGVSKWGIPSNGQMAILQSKKVW
jgi:hypothetical protein